MKRLVQEIFAQLLMLGMMAAALIWIWRNRGRALGLAEWLPYRLLLWAASILFILICVQSFRLLSGQYGLKRYNPGDVESLRELGRVKRFHLRDEVARRARILESPTEQLYHWLRQRGYREIARRPFGIVLEKRGFLWDSRFQPRRQRVFLLYRSMLNVIILDHLLAEMADFADSFEPLAQRNTLLLVTDMDNDIEVLSAAAGVSNYLCRIGERELFVPALLDQRFGRLFYPLDHSLLGGLDVLFYRWQKWQLERALCGPVLERPRPAKER